MTSLQARNSNSSDAGFMKPLVELSRAIDAHSKCSQNLSNLYHVPADNAAFNHLRTDLFYEAKMYGDRVFQKSLGEADNFRYITATSHEARALSSPRVLNDLISYCQKVEAGAKTMVIQYTKIANRLSGLEKEIDVERKRVCDGQGYGFMKTISSWFSRGNGSSQDLQNLDILLSTIQSVKSAVLEMQLFLSSLWDLASAIGVARVDTVFRNTPNQGSNLNYSEVNSMGKALVDECARLRNAYKEFVQCIHSLRVVVPDSYRKPWFWDIEAS